MSTNDSFKNNLPGFNKTDEAPDSELSLIEKEDLGTPNLSSLVHSGPDELRTNAAMRLYIKELAKIPPLSLEEELILLSLSRRGDEDAQVRVINANLWRVVREAAGYARQGVFYVNLVYAGNNGLMKAVQNYKSSCGFPFPAYATWWIRKAIEQEIVEQAQENMTDDPET